MDRTRQLLSWGFSRSASPRLFAVLALAALLAVLGIAGEAAADDCVLLGGAISGGECRISGVVAPAKSGTFTIAETLHFLGGGQLPVAAAGITINVTSGDFVMDANTLIDGNVAGCNTGAAITVSVPAGNVNLKPGSIVRSNSCSGGFIQITTGTTGIVDIDGLVQSVGSNSGTGGNQKPGGGPITIKAGCALTISDDGVVSSRGLDPGADLVHLEGCTVVVNGLVESTGTGHAIPNSPANSCSDAPTLSPRRNPVTRAGKPTSSTGCVEIWAGTSLVIDSTGTHQGEVNADVGFSGGPQGRGWIDILAGGNININDGNGNPGFAVHANGGLQQNTDDGGLVLIQSYGGDVSATGDAVQADAISSGSSGGEIRIEARDNVNLNAAAIFARGDFDASGGFGRGGKIGPLASIVTTPPLPAPIRAFTGSLSWQNGVGDARPTGSLVTAANRGQINLQACTGVNTTGTTFPVNGVVVPPYPNVLAASCLGAPTVPTYVSGFPNANCTAGTCNIPGGGRKSGVKFNDKAGDGVKDPTDPGLANWEMRVYSGGVFVISMLTDATGFYQFNLLPGTYVVCEVLQTGWTQTFPVALGGNVVSCPVDPGVNLAPLGYQFTITDGSNETNNDFGNHVVPIVCEEDPTAQVTLAVFDPLNASPNAVPPVGVPVYPTVSEAYAHANNGDTIGIYSNTVENVPLDGDKTLKITQCRAAAVTALDPSKPVWLITDIGKLLIIGPDAVGGTIGWSLVTGGHELRGVRATGASLVGIQIGPNSSGNAVSFNTVKGSPVGVQIDGDSNDVRGGTVAANGEGVVLSSTASTNVFHTATVKNNAGNGIVVAGTSNTVKDNGRVDKNGANGILVTGAGNTIKNNQAGSDKTQGNTGDGIRVDGKNNVLNGNKTNANTLNGIHVTVNATGTALKGNQSNTSPSGGDKENLLAEYQLDVDAIDQGGNKADTISIPKLTFPPKCPTFAKKGTCE